MKTKEKEKLIAKMKKEVENNCQQRAKIALAILDVFTDDMNLPDTKRFYNIIIEKLTKK